MAATRSLSNMAWRLPVSFAPFIAGAVVGAWQMTEQEGVGRAPWSALLCASLLFLIILVLLELVVANSGANAERKKFGWCSIGIGDDGFISTSKVQAGLWTFGLALGLSFLGFLVVFGAEFKDGTKVTAQAVFSEGGASDQGDTDGGDSDWDNYLLLLGGPFAAAVIAKATTSRKAADGELDVIAGKAATDQVAQQGTETQQDAKAGDLLTDNVGNLRLADTQYVIFNVVLFAYVAASFYSKAVKADFGLPDVPATLLALTGVSAAGYVAGKVEERTPRRGPGITSVQYDNSTGTLTISGVCLRRAGLSDDDARSDTRVIATSPAETATPRTVQSGDIVAMISSGRVSTFSVKVTSGTLSSEDYIVTV